ncbi:MAG: single-stranded DNA-binding protein [Bacteroidetes bacterium]|nr:single-stranded DNA-binding protein [Bacteroidota bacterium]
MEITGRITKDAKVNETKNNKRVVAFSIAINDGYKTKDGEQVKMTTYIDCSYWRNDSIAQFLKKGTLVGLYGRLGVSAWKNKNNEPQASITFHTNDIKLLGRAADQKAERHGTSTTTEVVYADTKDDLPF